MHMTIVRWHIFFSHFSVLPIKPWMSLSLFGDTSSFHISPSNQSNPWCVCIKAPSASNASLHPSPLCIKGGGRKAQLHFFRGRAFGCVLVVVGVGLEETLSATRILGGWGHRQQTGSSPPRRCYNHTTHWHCTHFLASWQWIWNEWNQTLVGWSDQLEGSPLIWSRAKTTSQPGKDEMRVNKQSCFQSPGLNLTRKLPSEGSYNLAPTSYYSPALQPY